jgi:hypothetical protein
VHDPGKIVCDLAVAVAPGGDCLAVIAVLRAEPGVFGLVASDPTQRIVPSTLEVERLIPDRDSSPRMVSRSSTGAGQRVDPVVRPRHPDQPNAVTSVS